MDLEQTARIHPDPYRKFGATPRDSPQVRYNSSWLKLKVARHGSRHEASLRCLPRRGRTSVVKARRRMDLKIRSCDDKILPEGSGANGFAEGARFGEA